MIYTHGADSSSFFFLLRLGVDDGCILWKELGTRREWTVASWTLR